MSNKPNCRNGCRGDCAQGRRPCPYEPSQAPERSFANAYFNAICVIAIVVVVVVAAVRFL